MSATNLNETNAGGTIVNIANGVLGNADTSYTYLNFTRDGWRLISLIYTITATTLTVEATNDNPSVADSAATWVDVSTIILGAASKTATGYSVVTVPSIFSRIRFKRVTTNATNAIKIDVALAN